MAFTVTARQSGNSGETAATTLTTSSATESADSLLLVGSAAQNDLQTAAQDGQTLSGGGLTYTQVVQSDVVAWDGSANFRMRGAVHSAPISGSPSAHTITVDHYIEGGGADEGFYCVVALDVTGHDAADPVAQSATGASSLGGGDSESGSVTLAATPTVDNLVVVFFNAGADGGGGFAAPTFGGQSMTQVWNQDDNWTQAGAWYRVVDGTESTDTITCTDLGQSVGQYAAVAVEITAATGAAEQDITPAAQTVDVTPGTATIAPGAVDITPGAVTVEATPGTLSMALGVTPGAVSIDATPGTATVAPGAVDITPDPVTVTATPGTVTVSTGATPITPDAVTIDVTPGAVTVDLDIPVDGPTITATPGSVAVTQGLSVLPDAVTVEATPGTLTVAVGAVDITPDAVTVAVTPGALSISGGGVADPNPFSLTHSEPAGVTHRDPAGITRQEAFAISYQEPA